MSEPANKKPEVLVIDDDEALRHYLSELLQGEGYAVRLAPDGEVGMQAYYEARPDLVLTDIYMPYCEGIDLINKIRAHDAKLPIIAMSGGGINYRKTYLNAATCLGANAALPKPFTAQELLALITSLLHAK